MYNTKMLSMMPIQEIREALSHVVRISKEWEWGHNHEWDAESLARVELPLVVELERRGVVVGPYWSHSPGEIVRERHARQAAVLHAVSVFYLTSRGISGSTGPQPDGALAVRVGMSPTGEWGEWYQWGDVECRQRPAIATWMTLKEFTMWDVIPSLQGVSFRSHELFTVVRPEYYEEKRGEEGKDICGYCGKDNTSLRDGWACVYCHGV